LKFNFKILKINFKSTLLVPAKVGLRYYSRQISFKKWWVANELIGFQVVDFGLRCASDPSPMRWGMQHFQRACRGHVGYSKPEF
jgi:hypothetical protein